MDQILAAIIVAIGGIIAAIVAKPRVSTGATAVALGQLHTPANGPTVEGLLAVYDSQRRSITFFKVMFIAIFLANLAASFALATIAQPRGVVAFCNFVHLLIMGLSFFGWFVNLARRPQERAHGSTHGAQSDTAGVDIPTAMT